MSAKYVGHVVGRRSGKVRSGRWKEEEEKVDVSRINNKFSHHFILIKMMSQQHPSRFQ